jgi:carbamoyltransferase
MSEVKIIRKDKRKLIPGVVHVDGTGRLQTVTKDQNLHYFNLISAFFDKTRVPIILNTSFNENEPIVNNPVEAINCYERTNMDILVLGNWVFKR